ncbi:MAG TPA: GNAT family N-acetyltransferase [Symbiobacteriaceae bacterium]|nr:GNAT family N-acetyltransferase [Symbiobacteriaceae bacterium]
MEQVGQLTDSQMEELHQLYQNEWWTKGRTLADVRIAVAHSGVVVAFTDPQSGSLAAFCRVITDFVYKALVLDVIVAAPYRGMGLGRALMDAVVSHPSLREVRHLELYCRPELMEFYHPWGFTEDLGELRFMRSARA